LKVKEAAMQAGITKEMLQALALANGVHLPEARLEAVLRQYQLYLESLARLDTLPLPREAEPEIIYALPAGGKP
jgi:hypothetical protein